VRRREREAVSTRQKQVLVCDACGAEAESMAVAIDDDEFGNRLADICAECADRIKIMLESAALTAACKVLRLCVHEDAKKLFPSDELQPKWKPAQRKK
jgi:hypothetical protein